MADEKPNVTFKFIRNGAPHNTSQFAGTSSQLPDALPPASPDPWNAAQNPVAGNTNRVVLPPASLDPRNPPASLNTHHAAHAQNQPLDQSVVIGDDRAVLPPHSLNTRHAAHAQNQPLDQSVIIGDDRVVLPIFDDYVNRAYSSLYVSHVLSGNGVREIKQRVVDIRNGNGANIHINKIYIFFSAAFNYGQKIIAKEEWTALLVDIHTLYPRALILVGGIVQPLFGGRLKYNIKNSNAALHKVQLPYVRFVDPRLITKSPGKRGEIYRNLYADPLYLNHCGVYNVLNKMIQSSFCSKCHTLLV